METTKIEFTDQELNLLHDALITKMNRLSKCIEIVSHNAEIVAAIKTEIATVQALHTRICKAMMELEG